MLVKINFARHQHDTAEELKTERDCSHIGSCFAIIAALQYGVTTREISVERNLRTRSDLPGARNENIVQNLNVALLDVF